MPKQRISKSEFQVYFGIGTIMGSILIAIVLTAIFYDPDAVGMLLPFGVAGIGFIGWYIGGKVYDRRRRNRQINRLDT